jgi:hypothetical protein
VVKLSETGANTALDFTGLTPDDVTMIGETIQRIPQDRFDLKNQMTDEFLNGLDYLTEQDPEKAEAAYQALVTHTNERVRDLAAIGVATFAEYEPERALPIWSTLIRHRSSWTRYTAISVAEGVCEQETLSKDFIIQLLFSALKGGGETRSI